MNGNVLEFIKEKQKTLRLDQIYDLLKGKEVFCVEKPYSTLDILTIKKETINSLYYSIFGESEIKIGLANYINTVDVTRNYFFTFEEALKNIGIEFHFIAEDQNVDIDISDLQDEIKRKIQLQGTHVHS